MIIVKTDWGFLNLPTDSFFEFWVEPHNDKFDVRVSIGTDEEGVRIVTSFEKEEDAKNFLENLFEMIKRHEPDKVLSIWRM